MTWREARKLARAGKWVRRAAWTPGRVLAKPLPGIWTVFGGGVVERVTRADDFGRAEFLATDWEVYTAVNGSRLAVGIIWEALTRIDDDVMLECAGERLTDTQLNFSWYAGEELIPVEQRGFQPESNLRKVSVPVSLSPGAVVRVYVMDGWGDNWWAGLWKARVIYSDGSDAVFYGGREEQGRSAVLRSGTLSGTEYYLQTGPHFVSYIENGEFVV